MTQEAKKFDDEKLMWSLVPMGAVSKIALVLMFGAQKYGAWNWSKGMAWTRLYDAAMRHLVAWREGENNDPESGMNHLWHCGCCILFLIYYQIHSIGKDDRTTH